MITYFTPSVRPEDHEAFRRILDATYPATHEEWLQLAAQKRADRIGRESRVVEVEVDPAELARHLTATGQPNNLDVLFGLAFEKGRPQGDE